MERVPVVAESMAERRAMQARVMLAVLAVSQDQTTRPVEQRTTAQGSLQAEQVHSITQQV